MPDEIPNYVRQLPVDPVSEAPRDLLPSLPRSRLDSPFALQPQTRPPAPRRQSAAKAQAKEEASQSPFSVTVGQVYDGPLDLLLDLIRKQNIDIYDIPIARITSQFLEYTHHLKQVDVDSAGEFIYMASLLIHIKSKTLLPRDPSDVLGGPTPKTRAANSSSACSSTSASKPPRRC